jgi:hypothetical protein
MSWKNGEKGDQHPELSLKNKNYAKTIEVRIEIGGNTRKF